MSRFNFDLKYCGRYNGKWQISPIEIENAESRYDGGSTLFLIGDFRRRPAKTSL